MQEPGRRMGIAASCEEHSPVAAELTALECDKETQFGKTFGIAPSHDTRYGHAAPAARPTADHQRQPQKTSVSHRKNEVSPLRGDNRGEDARQHPKTNPLDLQNPTRGVEVSQRFRWHTPHWKPFPLHWGRIVRPGRSEAEEVTAKSKGTTFSGPTAHQAAYRAGRQVQKKRKLVGDRPKRASLACSSSGEDRAGTPEAYCAHICLSS